MKNVTIILLAIILFTISCCKSNDDDPKPTCGCEADPSQTYTDVIGQLKKNSGSFYINLISNQYYIQYGSPPNVTLYYAICNIDAINGITVTENNPVNVKFSGDGAKLCLTNSSPYGYITIKLTKIQLQ